MTTPKYKIIIAEKQPIITYGLQSFLDENSSFEVIGIVDNGSSLINLLKQSAQANTIIIGLNLPRTNIYSIVKEILTIYPYIKIIVFTHYKTPKLVQSMMEYGVHAYIGTTADLEEIQETIHKVHEGVQIISPTVYEQHQPAGKIKEDLIDNDSFINFTEITERELEIIVLLSKGMTSKEMAQELNISIHTVETHRKNLMRKMKLKTTAQLVHLATLQGVV